MVIAKWPSAAARWARCGSTHLRRPNGGRRARGAQHVQPDEHEAGASSSCDAVTHDMTEASLSQVPAAEKYVIASVTRTRAQMQPSLCDTQLACN